MLVWTSRVAAGAATTVVVVVGGDAVVGQALELLLRGSGYDARFEALPTLDPERVFRGTSLVLLAPGLGEHERDTILSSAAAHSRNGGPAIVELIPAAISRSGKEHALIPWPCRPEHLESEIEDALRKVADRTTGRATSG